LSHPLAKPIVPHLPDPVKSLVNANGEWEWGSWVEKGGVGEFESARVYLARWARIVAEEGELARRREAQAIPSSSGDVEEETSSLGIFELLHSTSNLPTPKATRDPRHPVNESMWNSWFDDETGTPKVGIEVMKREVFRRGVDPHGTLRRKVWPFILGVHDWDATKQQRAQRWEQKRCAFRLQKVYIYSPWGDLGDGIMKFWGSGVEFRKYLTVMMSWMYVSYPKAALLC
jgi:TBC1 domain family member 15